jgi:hypothetical protein
MCDELGEKKAYFVDMGNAGGGRAGPDAYE